MTCGHCVASVTEELEEIDGVECVDVTLATGARRRHQRRPLDAAVVEEAVARGRLRAVP